jgi:hypothetical protein
VISVPYQLRSSIAAQERASREDARIHSGDLRRGNVVERTRSDRQVPR